MIDIWLLFNLTLPFVEVAFRLLKFHSWVLPRYFYKPTSSTWGLRRKKLEQSTTTARISKWTKWRTEQSSWNRRAFSVRDWTHYLRINDDGLVSIDEKEQREALKKYYKTWEQNHLICPQDEVKVPSVDQEKADNGHICGSHIQPHDRNQLYWHLLDNWDEQCNQPNNWSVKFKCQFLYT